MNYCSGDRIYRLGPDYRDEWAATCLDLRRSTGIDAHGPHGHRRLCPGYNSWRLGYPDNREAHNRGWMGPVFATVAPHRTPRGPTRKMPGQLAHEVCRSIHRGQLPG